MEKHHIVEPSAASAFLSVGADTTYKGDLKPGAEVSTRRLRGAWDSGSLAVEDWGRGNGYVKVCTVDRDSEDTICINGATDAAGGETGDDVGGLTTVPAGSVEKR
jgi:hypothetical protein